MDLLAFVASVVEAVAWPVVLLFLLILLRAEIRGLAPNLLKLRFRDLELEFGKRVQQLEERIEQETALQIPEELAPPGRQIEGEGKITLPSPHVSAEGTVRRGGVNPIASRLAPISPRAAVAEAWRDVEHALADTAEEAGVEASRSVKRTAEALVKRGFVPDFTISLLEDLRTLRNEAIHAREMALTTQEALEYAELAAHAERLIRSKASPEDDQ